MLWRPHTLILVLPLQGEEREPQHVSLALALTVTPAAAAGSASPSVGGSKYIRWRAPAIAQVLSIMDIAEP